MNKAELIALGVKEENVPEFNKRWWDDVRKQAKQMAKEGQKQPVNSAKKWAGEIPAHEKEPAKMAALLAMVRLIDDPVRQNFILETVNREYYYQEKEKARKEYEAKVEELRQKMHQTKSAGKDEEKPRPEEAEQEAETEQEEEKAGEWPEAVPGVG